MTHKEVTRDPGASAAGRAPGFRGFPDVAIFLFVVLAFTGMLAAAARSASPGPDPVLFWNDQANRAIQATSTDPFQASRALALESIAVLDTLRSIGGGPGFLVRLAAPRGFDPGVAAAAAARSMLGHLFPTQGAALDAALAASLANQPAGPARDRAQAFGTAVANAVFAVRDSDGWKAVVEFRTGTAQGEWRPTPPKYLPPLHPQWASLTPFVMVHPDQFRPPTPPALGSAAFRDATALVASIGAADSRVRTLAQSEIARYWSDAIGTYAPAGHWNAIASSLAAPLDLGLDAEAELFAELNVAVADSGIAIADAKYTYWFWRPITVIRTGGSGEPPVPDWKPLLDTPNHPSYISGHSGFSGAAAVVLTSRFGTRPFSFTSASLPGVTRTFVNFEQAAEEAAASRVYGGIHYPFDNAAGLATGRAVGAWTLAAFRRIAEDRGPNIAIMQRNQPLAGYAVDNASPLTKLTIRLGNGRPFVVPVDEWGRFAVSTPRVWARGESRVTVTATSATGRTTSARVEVDGAGENGAVAVPVTVQ